jgi:predicted  nucleic acid-binding Zn-ribbon protein
MSVEALTREVADLKRRLEIAETKIAQQAGQFEFISGQLRDVQLYMHARFDDFDKAFAAMRSEIGQLRAEMDRCFAEMDRRFAEMNAKIDALPRVLAELLAKRT